MNLHRIQINAVDKNEAAIRLYKKLGAVEEGRLREAFYFQNKYHDVIVYSLLKQNVCHRQKNATIGSEVRL
jgi:RimJ/RimL family protein N-acetyltransferase